MSDDIIKQLRRDLELGSTASGRVFSASPENIAALLDRLDAAERENERLRSAINWACGYDEGPPHFGEQPERDAPYAWRHELRRRAGMPWKETRVMKFDAAKAAQRGKE